jgi:hypothetical protein
MSGKVPQIRIDTVPFKVGDVITAYQKGFHRCVDIQKRVYDKNHPDCYRGNAKEGDEYNPLVVYEPLLDGNFKPRKGKPMSCDASFCEKVDEAFILKLVAEKQAEIAKARAALGDLIGAPMSELEQFARSLSDHPIVSDKNGVLRYQKNGVIDHLIALMHAKKLGGYDLCALSADFQEGKFSLEDYMDFYRMMGYSLGGFEEVFSEQLDEMSKKR